jgi:MarR family 2-MHQ and catechol resistance regulon transcriptional repressor
MGTHYKGTSAERRALAAYITLMRASESVSASLLPDLHRANLATSQLGVLDALHHLGPMCQREIGEKILKSPGNITTVIDNLEKRGLVGRRRDEEDRRYITVHLTAKGRKLIAGFLPIHVGGIVGAMKHLTAGEQKQLTDLCRKLGHGAAGRRKS